MAVILKLHVLYVSKIHQLCKQKFWKSDAIQEEIEKIIINLDSDSDSDSDEKSDQTDDNEKKVCMLNVKEYKMHFKLFYSVEVY
jgi:hypothetical protein